MNDEAASNLYMALTERGVDPASLVPLSGEYLEAADYLARLSRADLFLDTLPYNAHTTASDALWAGVPVLTCLGSTFAGRVAASALQTVGLPELVTNSLDEYEALALKLAGDPALLGSLRERLAQNRMTSALFDNARLLATSRPPMRPCTRHGSAASRRRPSASIPSRANSIPIPKPASLRSAVLSTRGLSWAKLG